MIGIALAGDPLNPLGITTHDNASAFISPLPISAGSGFAGRILTSAGVPDIPAITNVAGMPADLSATVNPTPRYMVVDRSTYEGFHVGGTGAMVAGVNTMTGRHSQTISLGGISASGGISFPLNLSYQAPLPTGMSYDQGFTPAFNAGYGWNIDFPFIVSDHKGTFSPSDDEYYANLGTWGGGKLVPDLNQTGYQLQSNPNIKFRLATSSIPTDPNLPGSVTGWLVKLPDGTTLVLGVRPDAIRKTYRNGAMVGIVSSMTSPNPAGITMIAYPPDFPYRWDVTEIRAPLNRGIIRFDWRQYKSRESFLNPPSGQGLSVSEAWPTSIWTAYPDFAIDESVAGNEVAQFQSSIKEIDRVNFTWNRKAQEEIFTSAELQNETRPGVEVQTRYLANVEFKREGKSEKTIDLKYTIDSRSVDNVSLKKRLLMEVIQSNNSSAPIGDKNKWLLSYDQNSGWLNKIVDPAYVKTEYQLSALTQNAGDLDLEAGVIQSSVISEEAIATSVTPVTIGGSVLYYNVEFRKNRIAANQSTCIGDFCYVIAKTEVKSISQQCSQSAYNTDACPAGPNYNSTVLPKAGTRVEVYRRSIGGMRKVFSKHFATAGATDVNYIPSDEIFPQDGYFIVKSSYGATPIMVYQWDGNTFQPINPIANDSRFPAGSGNNILNVYPSSGDYFLFTVAVGNLQSSSGSWNVVPVVRKSNGDWISLNRDQMNCDLDIGKSYERNLDIGEPMNWRTGCSQYGTGDNGHHEWTLFSISATPKFFVAAQSQYGIIQVFRRNPGVTGDDPKKVFTNESLRMKTGDGSINADTYEKYQGTVLPWNNHNMNPLTVTAGDNFFTIRNLDWNDRSKTYFHTWSWDGIYWTPKDLPNRSWDLRSWHRPTVVQSAIGGQLLQSGAELFRLLTPNQPTLSMQMSPFTTDENTTESLFPRLNSSRYFSSMDIRGPDEFEHQIGGVNASYLFYKWGSDLSSQLNGNGGLANRLFDLQFSPNEDWMIGKLAVQESGVWKMKFYWIPLTTVAGGSSSGSLPAVSSWTLFATVPFTPLTHAPKISFGPGVWMLTYGDGTTMKTEFHPMYSSGPVARFAGLETQVVSAVTSQSLYNKVQGKVTAKTGFTYSNVTYNGLEKHPESQSTVVKQYGADGTTVSSTQTINYVMERLATPLDGTAPTTTLSNHPQSQYFVGQVLNSTTVAADGITNFVKPIYQLQTRQSSSEFSNWGPGVARVISVGDTTIVTDRGSSVTSVNMVGNFDPVSGVPQLKLRLFLNPAGEGVQARHQVQATSYNSLGNPLRIFSALYKSKDDALSLLTKFGDIAGMFPYIQNECALPAGQGYLAACLSDEVNTYSSNGTDLLGLTRRGQTTRGIIQGSLEAGTIPRYSDNIYTQISSLSPERSLMGFPLYSMDNTTGIKTSYVYEGLRGLPTVVARNASPENVAVMTGERGPNWLGDGGNWWAPNADVDATMAHSGRYSMKIAGAGSGGAPNNNFRWGPTTNIYLKDVKNWTNGLTISMWIYSTGITPDINVEAHLGTGADAGSFNTTNTPPQIDGGSFKPNTWQRWKMVIPRSQLLNPTGSMPIFADNANADYLRIYPYYNSNNASSTMWVDDIVIAPTDAQVSLKSYDYAGRVIGSVDPDGHTTTMEYGPRGELQAVRDERGRIFGQNAVIGAGE